MDEGGTYTKIIIFGFSEMTSFCSVNDWDKKGLLFEIAQTFVIFQTVGRSLSHLMLHKFFNWSFQVRNQPQCSIQPKVQMTPIWILSTDFSQCISVCFYFPSLNMLYSIDFFSSKTLLVVKSCSRRKWITSVELLFEKVEEHVEI